LPVLIEMQAIGTCPTGERGCNSAGPTFSVGAGSQYAIGETHRRGLGPGNMRAHPRTVADQVRRARGIRRPASHPHTHKCIHNLPLFVGERGIETLLFPVHHIHRRGVERRRHAHARAFTGPAP
jgi:hypothetical protein